MQHDQLHYSMPPYPQQCQPEPGLAGKMSPRPDHGETSYHGSGRLAGNKALITGGTLVLAERWLLLLPAKVPMS